MSCLVVGKSRYVDGRKEMGREWRWRDWGWRGGKHSFVRFLLLFFFCFVLERFLDVNLVDGLKLYLIMESMLNESVVSRLRLH